MTDENINQQLALNGILSQKTLLSNLGYDYATEKKNKEEETEIPYNTVTPDTSYVSPNDVDTTTATTPSTTQQASQTSQKSTTTSTTGSQTNNQIANKTKTTTETVKDRTKNVKKTQTREGRPNK